MSSGNESKGVDLDSIFALKVSGTSPGLTGIQNAGTDIATRYQPLPGAAAPATGILCKVGGAGSFVDLNTLFSTTAPLPINGETFTAGSVGTINHGSTAQLTFIANTDGTYLVQKGINNGTGMVYTTLATGTWNTTGNPASAMQAMFTASIGPNGGLPLAGGWLSNPAASWTSVSSALGITDSVSVGSTSGTQGNIGTLQIQFRVTSTSQVTSNSTIYFSVDADGST